MGYEWIFRGMLWRHLEDGSGQEGSVVTHLFDPLPPVITPRKGWQKRGDPGPKGLGKVAGFPNTHPTKTQPHRLMKGTEPVMCVAGP